jgi:hypothetical protein
MSIIQAVLDIRDIDTLCTALKIKCNTNLISKMLTNSAKTAQYERTMYHETSTHQTQRPTVNGIIP